MPLADHVSVSRRFQRAIRIDTDLRRSLTRWMALFAPDLSECFWKTWLAKCLKAVRAPLHGPAPTEAASLVWLFALSALLSPDKAMGRRAARASR